MSEMYISYVEVKSRLKLVLAQWLPKMGFIDQETMVKGKEPITKVRVKRT